MSALPKRKKSLSLSLSHLPLPLLQRLPGLCVCLSVCISLCHCTEFSWCKAYLLLNICAPFLHKFVQLHFSLVFASQTIMCSFFVICSCHSITSTCHDSKTVVVFVYICSPSPPMPPPLYPGGTSASDTDEVAASPLPEVRACVLCRECFVCVVNVKCVCVHLCTRLQLPPIKLLLCLCLRCDAYILCCVLCDV